MDFVHLHCHTEYSLLDGAIKIPKLCEKALEYNMKYVSITDHGNMFGCLEFYLTAKKYGLIPIIGCEVYVAPEHRTKKEARSLSEVGYHLVLLAMNNEGYKNLIKLVSLGYLEGFYYKPRVDIELLKKYNSGLIALSACLKGEIPYALMNQGMDSAIAVAEKYKSIFQDRFYLELMANGIKEQEEVNEKLIELSKATNLPLVATNDCHYLNKDDALAHDILLCIQTNSCVNDAKRMRFNTDQLYFKSPDEMYKQFSSCPEAIENSVNIAKKCNVEIEVGKHHFPLYIPESGLSLEEEFKRLAREGLKKRLKNMKYSVNEKVYWERLEKEIDVICKKGFPGYFLIVQDFINWAKSQGIPVGPGRGSAAGSLVAYSLGITELDPIKYNLLFERFLNVERASLPDIDVDFCYNRREEVIKYVTEKYGKLNVAQITTFGKMKAKAVVRDVARALGISYQEADKIAKLIPNNLKMTIDKALEVEPELKQMVEEDPKIRQLIEISRKLEGLARHASTHAAGIVISDKPMMEYLPLYVGKKGEVVTQYDMKMVEKVGLIKFDFLGLKTLTVLNDAVKLAKQNNKDVPPLNELPLDDKKTFELLCRGQTDGVFQLESSGMKNVLMELKPSCFEDIIALLALYRPGPLESGMVMDFIKRKHKEVEVTYPHPRLEPILKDTYGVILYQEQVMQIASELANYSLGDGDILRRAMGKKIPEVMAEQRAKFLEGAKANGIEEKTANYIFDLMEKFAGYGFNKSHSAAYALISYQCAYMKAHYPVEFMAALLTSEADNTDKVISHINACRQMGIEVLQPDINKSEENFSVENDSILFGLCAIKNVGIAAVQEIIKERDKNGPFRSLFDFCRRLSNRKITKRVTEYLIKSGAFDVFGHSRRGMFEALDKILAATSKKSSVKKKRGITELTLPGVKKKEENLEEIEIPELTLDEWPDEEKLRYEKESLGFYVSSHPILKYKTKLSMLDVKTIEGCKELPSGSEVNLVVIINSYKDKLTKTGEKMAFCQIEDLSATAEMVLFPSLYLKIKSYLDLDEPFLCKVKTDIKEVELNNSSESDSFKKISFVCQDIVPLKDVEIPTDKPFIIECDIDLVDMNKINRLKEIFQKYPGETPVQIKINYEDAVCYMQLGPKFFINLNPNLEQEIKEVLFTVNLGKFVKSELKR